MVCNRVGIFPHPVLSALDYGAAAVQAMRSKAEHFGTIRVVFAGSLVSFLVGVFFERRPAVVKLMAGEGPPKPRIAELCN